MDIVRSWLGTAGTFALSKILPTLIILALGILVIQLLVKAVEKILAKSKLEKAAYSLILSVIKVAAYVLLALVAASKLGLDVTGIVALASVLTLAVSLALQNILANVIGGFTLLYTKPFSSGDFVEIAGQSGSVQEIGLTYTKLATGDNKLVSIPNSAVVAAQITNFTVTGKRRVDISVSASYDSAVEDVLDALREAAKVPTAMEDPAPFVAVDSYGDSAINYILRIWSTADDYWTTRFDANKKVKEIFDARGITMTYPHINVHLDK